MLTEFLFINFALIAAILLNFVKNQSIFSRSRANTNDVLRTIFIWNKNIFATTTHLLII